MSAKTTPKSIDVQNSDQVLVIRWQDGVEHKLGLFGLRKNCPCVECRGGHDKMGQYEIGLFLSDPPADYRVVHAEAVGNHALKISWDDGHNAGMYRWDLLRSMGEAVEAKSAG
ncbi:MAG: DUF971 domain-containing protein [Balneolaceae bacterium]